MQKTRQRREAASQEGLLPLEKPSGKLGLADASAPRGSAQGSQVRRGWELGPAGSLWPQATRGLRAGTCLSCSTLSPLPPQQAS